MNNKILYLECAAGISGDMFCGALLDLGVAPEKLRQVFDSLNVPGFHWHFDHVDSHGLRAGSFQVHIHDHEHEHDHDHEHGHEHHHHHEHRNLDDVLAIIDRGAMCERAKTLAREIFTIVAEAEAVVHGKLLNEVHFHEVGALDSIADIIGAAVLFDELGIDKICMTELSEGHGFVECAHGKLPVPVPAVTEIVRNFQLPLAFRKEIEGEMVTPTGAAIAACLREKFSCAMPEKYTVSKIGLGAGTRDFGVPNVLRAMILEPCSGEKETPDTVRQIEVNLDDCSGECVGLAMEKLFQTGALDVNIIPCQMKKNRPAFLLRVLCRISDFDKIAAVIFKNTTTIGLRYADMKRLTLPRMMMEVSTPFGLVAVKKCSFAGENFFYPEYESVAAAAERTGRSFAEIYAAARSNAEKA